MPGSSLMQPDLNLVKNKLFCQGLWQHIEIQKVHLLTQQHKVPRWVEGHMAVTRVAGIYVLFETRHHETFPDPNLVLSQHPKHFLKFNHIFFVPKVNQMLTIHQRQTSSPPASSFKLTILLHFYCPTLFPTTLPAPSWQLRPPCSDTCPEMRASRLIESEGHQV